MTDRVDEALENLYNLAMKDGAKVPSFESDRKRDGSYVSGFKKEKKVATLEHKAHTIIATVVQQQVFNLSFDRESTNYTLEIQKDGKKICIASRAGVTVTKKFGDEERYTGTETTDATVWQITEGKLPAELHLVAA